ncbi:MAG: hypothetical protein AMJ53_05740, partial [Gammaproteobacteria bacterium SG8_11]
MSGNSKDPKLAVYFQPGQVMFHVTGTATKESTKILFDNAKKLAESMELQISTPRIQNFPPAEKYNDQQSRAESGGNKRGPFFLLYADVTKDGERLGDQQGDLMKLLNLIFLLDDELAKPSNESVQVVSPNWLMSGSREDPGGTGGPGGRPSPYVGNSDNTEYKFNISESFPQQYLDYLRPDCDENVVVAILDTAPYPKSWLDLIISNPETTSFMTVADQGEWEYIYDKWVHQRQDPHTLIRTLLDPTDRRLTIYPDPRVMDGRFKNMTCIDHEYEMNDHGLFVAGIIHSLAPHAELHLFQVLNSYGLGNLEIIGETLINVFRDFEGKPLILNLSLNYGIPLERAHTKEGKTHTKEGKELVPDVSGGEILGPKRASWLIRAIKPAELMCDLFYDRKSGIIAAAGNDWDDQQPGDPRPQARYPAAFDHVVGVGALTRGGKGVPRKAASYSNLADRPPMSGTTTLGGEEGTGNGILGTYTGEFPDGSPNDSGWAWWCGTSFATPIISGLVAAILSCMLSENP